MKQLIGAVIMVSLLGTLLPAQEPLHVFTRPPVPSAEVLDRLNLKLAWRLYVPVEGKNDGLYSVQLPERYYLKQTERGLIPTLQMVVQTRAGLVMALDPETGDIYWRRQIGGSGRLTVQVGANTRSFFVVRGPTLYALDRKTGVTQWELGLAAEAAAPPVADAQQLYLSLADGRLYVYHLPDLDFAQAPIAAAAPGKEPNADPFKGLKPPPGYFGSGGSLTSIGPLNSALEAGRGVTAQPNQPILLWDFPNLHRTETTSLLSGPFWFLPGSDGTAFTMLKIAPKEVYRLRTDGPIDYAPGQHGDVAYLASADHNLYALAIADGRELWTYTTGTAILEKPLVTDADIFTVTGGDGLQRLDRGTGARQWRKAADSVAHVLSVNPKFVYARDRTGRLMILDRARGNVLTAFNMRDYTTAVENELTDRLYLGSNDGLLICLRDRDYAQAVPSKSVQTSEQAVPGNPIYDRLTENVTLAKGMSSRSLKDAVDFFGKAPYRLPIVVAERSFADAGEPGILDKQVLLPRMDLVPLNDVMRQLLKQVNAVYLIQPDHVLIIPAKGQRP